MASPRAKKAAKQKPTTDELRVSFAEARNPFVRFLQEQAVKWANIPIARLNAKQLEFSVEVLNEATGVLNQVGWSVNKAVSEAEKPKQEAKRPAKQKPRKVSTRKKKQ